MQYLYHPDASSEMLELTGDRHKYIFKVRRHREKENIYLRNLNSPILYQYHIETLDRNRAILRLLGSREYRVMPSRLLHVGWCIIDPKSIEKLLPMLNEIGVEKITFIYCDRSQKQFKPDLIRLEKILINSSQQSGRSTLMVLDFKESLEVFLDHYPEASLLHFSDKHIDVQNDIETIVVGCEGGLSAKEIMLFNSDKVVGLDTPMILRSESAVSVAASKLLL